MSDAGSSKRTVITLSPQPVKRLKTEHLNKELSSSDPVPLTASHGVERIPLPPSARLHRTSPRYLEQITRERTEILSGQSRRVVGRPLVMDDGIVIHWVHVENASESETACEDASLVNNDLGLQSSTTSVRAPPTSQLTLKRSSERQNSCFLTRSVSVSGFSQVNAILRDNDESDTINNVRDSDSDIEFVAWTRHGQRLDKVDQQDDEPSCVQSASDSYRPTGKVRSPHMPVPYPSSADALSSISANESADDDAGAESANATCERIIVENPSGSSSMEISDGSEGDACESSAVPVMTNTIHGFSERREQQGGPAPNLQEYAAQQKRLLNKPPSRRKRGSFPEHSVDDAGADYQSSKTQSKRVLLPKTHYGRPRRLLMPASSDLPFIAITMRGDCHFIHRKDKFRISLLSLPNPGVFSRVEDACIVGDTVVLGHDNGPHQISFLPVTQRKANLIDVARSPHSSGLRYNNTLRRGVNCLAAMHAEAGHIKFFSGGHDGTIHRWTVSMDALHNPHSEKVASHGTALSALAYHHHHTSLLSSTQKTLFITDLNRGQTVPNPFSNDIQHIHVHPQIPFLTLFEVRHLDRQVLLFDSRKANYSKEACMSFGRRNPDAKFSPSHNRGSVHLAHFARGSEDGSVLLWDFRNRKEAVVVRRYHQDEKVVHTIFADSDVATLGQGVVTFFENYLVG